MKWTHDEIAPDFGEIVSSRIEDLRVAARTSGKRGRPKSFTYDTVARKCGFRSPSSISRITNGKRITFLRPSQFWALAEVLEFEPEEMLEAAGFLPGRRP